MPRCAYQIPSSKRLCKLNAVNGSCYCKRHSGNPNDTEEVEVELAMPPIDEDKLKPPVEPPVEPPIEPAVVTPDNINKVEDNETEVNVTGKEQACDIAPPKPVVVKVIKRRAIDPVTGDSVKDVDIMESELTRLTTLVEDLCAITKNLTINNNIKIIKPVKTPSPAAILRRAHSMYYHDFKSDSKMVDSIRQVAITSGLILPSGKLPWMNVKYVSDQYFDKLDEITKKMYMDSANTYLQNKLRK